MSSETSTPILIFVGLIVGLGIGAFVFAVVFGILGPVPQVLPTPHCTAGTVTFQIKNLGWGVLDLSNIRVNGATPNCGTQRLGYKESTVCTVSLGSCPTTITVSIPGVADLDAPVIET
mgnify:CR=1 FL=1